MMRVAVVGLRGIPNVIGGIETQSEQLYVEMLRHRRDFDFHVYGRPRYMPDAVGSYRGLTLHRIWAPRRGGLEAFVHTFLAVLHARIILRAPLVHIHGIGPAFWSPLVRLLGGRTVVTHHAPDFERPKWGRLGRLVLRRGEYLAARFADRIVCVSHSVEQGFLARHPEARGKTRVVTNALPLPSALDRVAEEDGVLDRLGLIPGRYILAVGRIEETKRFHDLIAARQSLPAGSPPVVIAGTAPQSDRYEKTLLREAGPGTVLAGFCPPEELAALYSHCALFVHPSAMEGFGLVVIEALSHNAPVAISDIPPHREFGLPERCYFPVGDVDAIARAIGTEGWEDFAVPDRRGILDRYDIRAMARRYVDLFLSTSSVAACPPLESESITRQ